MDRRPLPGTIRRRKRKRAPNRQQVSFFKVMLALMVLLISLAWTIGLLWFSLSMNLEDSDGKAEASSQDHPPPRFFNLWPSDTTHTPEGLLIDCPHCDNPSTVERVLLVRPPGQFADILSGFMETYLRGSDIDFVTTAAPLSAPFPVVDPDAVLVHVMTLPLLLEAFDVLLEASDPSKALLTGDDVLAVVQHLIQWHCRVVAHAQNRRSLVLTLDPTLSSPLRTERKLETLYNQSNVPILRDDFAKKALDHIDQGTDFWEELMARGKGLRSKESDLPERARALIQKSMPGGACPNTFPPLSSGWFSHSSPLETLLDSLWETAASGETMDEN